MNEEPEQISGRWEALKEVAVEAKAAGEDPSWEELCARARARADINRGAIVIDTDQ